MQGSSCVIGRDCDPCSSLKLKLALQVSTTLIPLPLLVLPGLHNIFSPHPRTQNARPPPLHRERPSTYPQRRLGLRALSLQRHLVLLHTPRILAPLWTPPHSPGSHLDRDSWPSIHVYLSAASGIPRDISGPGSMVQRGVFGAWGGAGGDCFVI